MSGGGSTAEPPLPIAIIGIGCRFPGGIVDTESFWRVLADGVDAITEIPADRFDIAKYYDPTPGTRGRIMTRWGGFVDQRLEDFDADFFGISKTYAERLDPQQRLLLETAWEALEDAGLDIVGMQGSPTGVFVGQWVSDFEHRLFADTGGIDFAMAMGSGRYAASGRLSYAFGFRGPSLSIDAACSSGLASVHLAVRSLRSGDSAIALAGGVNMILQPHIHLAYSYSKMMAPDGRCRFGDARGSGYVRAEGAGMVVLKPLASAIAAGDRIYAVIRGSAVNSDGDSSGSMGRPSRIGQEEVLRSALRDGGVTPAQLDYVEAHGTGTRAGDPVELDALAAVASEGRASTAPRLWVGSVKTNIGHTEAAAGVAGLIKASLMLQRGMIPRSLHFDEPNPDVKWAELPIAIPTTLISWPMREGTRFAGVSSYGIGGTNAHVVLESAPFVARAVAATASRVTAADSPVDRVPLLLSLSARSEAALHALASRYAELLSETGAPSVTDVCWSAATRRSALSHRAAFVARDRETLVSALRAFASGEPATADGIVHDRAPRRLAFVVPGQGAQWTGMARQFMAENAVFRAALDACDAAARRVVPWSIIEQLHLDASDESYIGDRIDVIQPTLVALAIAYAGWLRSVGVVPDAVVGHSLGEVGAAAIAGVIDIETAMRIICRRSALMRRTSGQGAMAVIDLPEAAVNARLQETASSVTVSVSNSPRSTVVSGAPAAVQALLAQLDDEGVYARMVRVDVASHGSQMDPLVPELVGALTDVRPAAGTLPIYSTVLAARADGVEFDAAYWGRNLRQPVQFTRTVETMISDGITAFIELGPHAVLTYAISQTAAAVGRNVVVAACGTRETDDLRSATSVIAALWANGAAVDWRALMPWGGPVVRLPQYPWQRERFWYDTTAGARKSADQARGSTSHPFLGTRIETAADAGGVEWDVRFSTTDAPWLSDHVVRGSAIVPAAAMIDVLAAAVRETLGLGRDVVLRQVVVSEAISLREEPAVLRLVATRPTPDTLMLQLRVRDDAGWHVVATGIGSLADGAELSAPPAHSPISDTTAEIDGAVHYQRMLKRALAYGPAFQVVRALSAQEESATATLTAEQSGDVARRVTLLDGALQAILALAPSAFASTHETIVPVRMKRIVLRAAAWAGTATVTVSRTNASAAGVLSGAAQLRDDSGEPCCMLCGIDMQVVRGSAAADLASLRYGLTWTPVEATARAPLPCVRWLIVKDAGGAGARIATRLRDAGHDVCEWQASDVEAGAGLPDGIAHVVICSPLDATLAVADSATLDVAFHQTYDLPLAVIQCAASAAVSPTSVIVVTHGAVVVSASAEVTAPLQGAAWGLARVARHEHPSLGFVIVDAAPDAFADGLLGAITHTDDAELAWRDGQWWAGRVEPVTGADALPRQAAPATPTPYAAEVVTPGLVDSVGWRVMAPRALAPHEVLIEVKASGLNFLDLLVVLNAYPAAEPDSISALPALGLECTGIVTRVGSAVRTVAPGDRVMAVCEGSLASAVVATDALVVQVPDGVSFEDASGFPIAFLTAGRALEQVAQLRAGERVLIHSAGGGVGLAALQIARNRGAQILATAGTTEKRSMLREMGVQHVFDSRDSSWGDAVLAATDGAGVDVILNSLSGVAIETGFRVLAPYGRFVEIGKRDVFGDTRIGMDVFRKQVSVTAVYLLEQMRMDAAPLGALLHDLVARLSRGELTLLPTTRFAATDVSNACRAMVPGTHVGKMVVLHTVPPSAVRQTATGAPVRDDATYLITGGLGALGRRAAGWLVSRGAQHLVLVGRSAPAADAQNEIDEWVSAGVMVTTLAADIASDVGIALLRTRLASLPPLGGVIHAAGVLDDGLIAGQTPERMRRVSAAKVGGALQLATLPDFDAVDFVVMYSSVASALGTRGQANYAAANAVLDAVAHAWRSRGVRATSIGFGPFAGVGMATEGARLDILADSGLGALRPAHADAALDALGGSTSPHEIVAMFDSAAWIALYDTTRERRRVRAAGLSEAMPVSGFARSAVGLRAELATIAGKRQRADRVLQFVQEEVAAVLRTTAERIEPLKALRAMGIDSLTALELRNRLEQATGLRLAGTLVFNYPNPAAIAAHLQERLEPAEVIPPVAPASVSDEVDALVREMAGLDDEAVRQLLTEHRSGDGA